LLSFDFFYFLAFSGLNKGMFCGHGFCLFLVQTSLLLGFLWKKILSIAYGRHPWGNYEHRVANVWFRWHIHLVGIVLFRILLHHVPGAM
jgi:hypothetical protein